MTTRRFPGLAKEFVERQRAAALPRNPAPISRLVENHFRRSGACPRCWAPLPEAADCCRGCGWALGEACRVCGCTFDNACVDDDTGEVCDWESPPTGEQPGLCTNCATPQLLEALSHDLLA